MYTYVHKYLNKIVFLGGTFKMLSFHKLSLLSTANLTMQLHGGALHTPDNNMRMLPYVIYIYFAGEK